MADSNYKKKAARSSEGFVNNVIFPAIIGAFITYSLFDVIPEMFAITYRGASFAQALPQAYQVTFDAFYAAVMAGGDKDALGWPLLGAVAGVFLFRLYNLPER